MKNLTIEAKIVFYLYLYLTILKADENRKFKFATETFDLYTPKCPNVSKILPHVLDLKIFHTHYANTSVSFIVKHPVLIY